MSLYLILDLAVIAGPLALSFFGKTPFVRRWPAALFSVLVISVPFVAWDSFMTARGAWSFNARFVSAPRLFALPLEEIFFFLVVPFSCLFISEMVGAYFPDKAAHLSRSPRPAWFTVSGLCVGAVLLAMPRLYTSTVLGAAAAFFFLAGAFFPTLVWRRQFWLAVLLSYIPFFVMNGILTAMPVVIYDPAAIMGARVTSIPLEDFLYSFTLLGFTLAIYEALRGRGGRD